MKTTTSRTPRIPNVIPSPLLIQCFSPPAPLKGPKKPISNWTTHISSVPHPCDLPLSQGWETTKPILVKPVQPTSKSISWVLGYHKPKSNLKTYQLPPAPPPPNPPPPNPPKPHPPPIPQQHPENGPAAKENQHENNQDQLTQHWAVALLWHGLFSWHGLVVQRHLGGVGAAAC